MFASTPDPKKICHSRDCKKACMPFGSYGASFNYKGDYFDYCDKHKCQIETCRFSQIRCPLHSCQFKIKKNRRCCRFVGDDTPFHHFCDIHSCINKSCNDDINCSDLMCKCPTVGCSYGVDCSMHACSVRSCRNFRMYGGSYCQQHSCSFDGCVEFNSGKSFCSLHTCGIHNCNFRIVLGFKYCNGHKCPFPSCNAPRPCRIHCCNYTEKIVISPPSRPNEKLYIDHPNLGKFEFNQCSFIIECESLKYSHSFCKHHFTLHLTHPFIEFCSKIKLPSDIVNLILNFIN